MTGEPIPGEVMRGGLSRSILKNYENPSLQVPGLLWRFAGLEFAGDNFGGVKPEPPCNL
jgi:hypothetical protein